MPRRIKLEPYLTNDEIEQRYRHAKEAVARSQWHIIWLIGQGRRSEEVAAVTSYTPIGFAWWCNAITNMARTAAETVGIGIPAKRAC